MMDSINESMDRLSPQRSVSKTASKTTKSLPRQLAKTISIARQASLVLVTLFFILGYKIHFGSCEAKDFDWSDLGVSLAGSKSPIYNGSSNNLRILVSPQRRMTKNYEFDFSNSSSQPSSGETSYVIPGSTGSYVSQPSSSSSAAHSSAYSALSASLATLKSRLNARGVSLGGALGEQASQSGLYQGSSLLGDSNGLQGQTQSQPTYLSVSNQQNQQSVGGYATSQGQNNDNKTIVLAIPAKINFLTDGRTTSGGKQQQVGTGQQQIVHQQQPQQSQAQQQQQAQQLTVIQTSNDQQTRPEYATAKQLGLLSGQEGAEAAGQLVGRDGSSNQEHHEYVIVNQSPAGDGGYASAQLVAQPQASSGSIHQSLYQTQAASAPQPSPSYAMKYIPAYPSSTVQQAIPKIYPPQADHSAYMYSEAQMGADVYGRYGGSGCLDTCNSADPRWRKYSVSKYKHCCSRSSQYDLAQFEQPSVDKLSEASRQADDAYYNYLYRRTRARRSRRQRGERYSNRYYGKSGSAHSGYSNEEAADLDIGIPGRQVSPPRGYQSNIESPYVRHYKGRQQQSAQGSYESPADLHENVGKKYAPSKSERSYRRSRARDFDIIDPQSNYDTQANDEAEGGVYPPEQSSRGGSSSAGYGSAEYSVDAASGRYSAPSESRPNDEDETRPANYDEALDQEAPSKSSAIEGSPDYPSDEYAGDNKSLDDTSEPETTPSYKQYVSRRRNKSKVRHGRKGANKEPKLRKNRKNKYNKQQQNEQQLSSQVNGTEHDSPANEDYRIHESNPTEEDQSTYNLHNKDSTSDTELDKESVLLSNKFRSISLNESAVVNLSKTTMHLKEILSMLEKKAQLKAANESISSQSASQQQQPQQPQQTTPSPVPMTTTTTNLYPYSLFSSNQYASNPSLQSALPTDYLASEMSLKSPYRFDSSSLSPSLSLPPPYSSLNLDSYSSLPSFGSNQYSFGPTKHLSYGPPHVHHPRKRRVNKNVRYNNLMMPKGHPHGLGSGSSLLHHAAMSKNQFLNSGYYPSLPYPYSYTRANYPPSTLSSYPYRNSNKNSYASSLNGQVASKLAAAASGALYSDESRVHGLASLDPVANVASSLRPSTTMRLRSKPFSFQQHVMPLYTRHTVLSQPVDVKK